MPAAIKKILNILIVYFTIVLISLILSNACSSGKKSDIKEETGIEKGDVIEIITENMEFQMADEISSGWHTFRYINKSGHTHFFLLDKYPEGKTLEDGKREVIPVFQKGMDLIMEGRSEEGYSEFSKLPKWFGNIVFTGGSGLISPHQSCETTINLEPGLYVVECYVKMENGMFHSTMGMVKEFIVTAEKVENSPLIPDINITISREEGIMYDKAVSKGEKTFSVYFRDQVTHENFVGHDVNLVRFDDYTDLVALEKWMNWADPKGLITPAPQGLTFLGGVNDMPAGSMAYFTVTLAPGNYALISEVPDALRKNMLKTFNVPE